MRIAICDDNTAQQAIVRSMLEKYIVGRKTTFTFKVFGTGSELLESMDEGEVYDLIYLDILMPGLSGIETAREIRRFDKNVKIIFLTTSSEFAVDSYAVGAYYYMLKPLWEEGFVNILEKAIRELNKKNSDSIIVSTGGNVKRILLTELMYCEILNHTICYHLSDGTYWNSGGTMAELEKELSRYPYFVKPHRSYLVNLRFVVEITQKDIILTHKITLPLARGRFDEIRRAFLYQPFEEAN